MRLLGNPGRLLRCCNVVAKVPGWLLGCCYVVQGSRFFIIRHIHNHTSIISSEMQVELK